MSTKKENNCKKYSIDLTEYVSGHPESVKDMKNLTSHLKGCSGCGKQLAEKREVIGILRGEKNKGIEKILEEAKKWPIPMGLEYPDVSPLIETGKDCLIGGKYKLAIKHFDEALLLNPKNGVVWYLKGRAHYNIGEDNTALTAFNKSIEYSCLSFMDIYYKGRIEQKLGIKADLTGIYKSIDNKIALLKKEIKQMERTKRLIGK